MPQLVPKSLRVSTPNLESPWNPRRLALLTGRACQLADLVLLTFALISTLLLTQAQLFQRELQPLLTAHLSVRNGLTALLCLGTWRTVLWSIGLYSQQPPRSLAYYIFRCVVALNSCAGVLGLIAVVFRARIELWHFLALFWLIGLAALTAMRVTLFLLGGSSRTNGLDLL